MVSFFLSTFVSAYFICGVDGFIFVRVLNLLLLDMVLIDEQVRFELRIYFVIYSVLDSHLKTKIVTNKLLISLAG